MRVKARHSGKTHSAKIHRNLPALPFPQKILNPSLLLMGRREGGGIKRRKKIINHSIAT